MMSECEHKWKREYYGNRCTKCGLFYPDGCAPWDEPIDDDDFSDDGYCYTCHGQGFILTCIDDICHGLGHCIHGDGEEPCPDCDGPF